MIKLLLTFLFSIGLIHWVQAQYTVQFRVSTVYSNVDDMDGALVGNSDPQWDLELEDSCNDNSGDFSYEAEGTNCPGTQTHNTQFFSASYQCNIPNFTGRWRGMEDDGAGSDANTGWININIPASALSIRNNTWNTYTTYSATADGDRCSGMAQSNDGGKVTWRITVQYKISGSAVAGNFCNIGDNCTSPIRFNVPKFNCGSTQPSSSPNRNINLRRKCGYAEPTASTNTWTGVTCGRPSSPRDTWLEFQLPDSTGGATVTFDNNGGCGSFCQTNINYAWYTSSNGTCSGLEYRGCDEVNCTIGCSDGTIYVDGRPGEKVWVRVWEEDNDPFELTITKITPRAPADRCYTAMPLEGYGCNYQATNYNEPSNAAWTAGAHPGGACQDGDRNSSTNTVWSSNENLVWYTYTHPATGRFSVAVDDMSCTGGAASAQLGLFRNLGTEQNPTCDLSTTQGMGCSVGVGGVELVINNLPAGNYILVVDGNAGAQCAWTFKDRLGGNLLPVKWISFEGSMASDNQSIVLDWVTEKEENNTGFHVQRSLDGIDFENINFVAAHGANVYEYKDYAYPRAAVIYYRLNQLDIDGTTALSKTIAVTTNINDNGVSILHEPFPNPTFGALTVPFITAKEDYVTVYIYDALGRMVQQVLDNQYYNEGQHFIQLDLNNDLPSGMYTLRFECGQGSQIKRFIKH